MQIIVYFSRNEVDDPGAERRTARSCSRAAELCLCLGFKHRFLDSDGNRCNNAVADIRRIEILFEVVADAFDKTFAEGLLVRSALGRVLTVHKAEVMFAVLVAMREGDFDILCLQMGNRVTERVVYTTFQQVKKPFFACVDLAVHHERKARVQIGVVPDFFFHVGRKIAVVLVENRRVRCKDDFRTGLFVRFAFPVFFDEDTFAEFRSFAFSVAEALNNEFVGKRIYRFCTDTVQTDRLLERFGIIFTAGIHLGNAVHDFTERDSTTVVTHTDFAVFNRNFNSFAGAHHEFIDRVVDDFLGEHVNTVVRALTVPEFTDVHTRTHPDMFMPLQRFNIVFCISNCHKF